MYCKQLYTQNEIHQQPIERDNSNKNRYIIHVYIVYKYIYDS